MRPLITCLVFVALTPALTGCVTSYKDIMEGGHKYSSESTRKPSEAASCIIERTQSQWPWRATQRPFGEQGVIEVVITSGGEGVAAVAHVKPSPYGSIVETWLTKRAVLTRDTLHEQFFGGC